MNLRFEKFERKFNFYLPDSYKILVTEMGEGFAVGNCEFFFADDFINNNLRLGGAMEVGLFPFGGLGNGDCFCFLKYGENPGEYCIVIWLSGTYNYVILNSTFDNFIYNCVVQEYKALLFPDEYMAEGTREEYEECIERINSICSLFDFDLNIIEKARDEDDLNSLILSRDPFAVQLLCAEGQKIIRKNFKAGSERLKRAMMFSPKYLAPYYILGKYLLKRDKKEAVRLLFRGAMTPLAASGFSYWDEDNINIPQNVMEEVFSLLVENKDILPDEHRNSVYMDFIEKREPYSPDFRFVLAQKYLNDGDYESAIREFNNVLLLSSDMQLKIKILNILIPLYKKTGLVWASGVCRKDIKYIKGLKN